MLVIRILALLALVGIGGALAAWMLTGNPKYRQWAWRFFLAALAILSLLLGLLVFERLFL